MGDLTGIHDEKHETLMFEENLGFSRNGRLKELVRTQFTKENLHKSLKNKLEKFESFQRN